MKALTWHGKRDVRIDEVGMEAHGAGAAKLARTLVGFLPDRIADPFMQKAGIDRLAALLAGIDAVRRWIDDRMPLVEDPADPLGVLDLTTHCISLAEAPAAYETFQKKEDGAIKVVIEP